MHNPRGPSPRLVSRADRCGEGHPMTSGRHLWVIEIRDAPGTPEFIPEWSSTTVAYMTRQDARDHREKWHRQDFITRILKYAPEEE